MFMGLIVTSEAYPCTQDMPDHNQQAVNIFQYKCLYKNFAQIASLRYISMFQHISLDSNNNEMRHCLHASLA